MLLGNEIRIQRVIKGYSQEYMANRLEISQNAYSKLERNETELSVKRLLQIASILEVQATQFLPQAKASSGIFLPNLKEWFLKTRLFWHKLTR
jgi:transcriptional regulator with XRE-family HTH domain